METLRRIVCSLTILGAVISGGCHSKVMTRFDEGTDPGATVDLPGAGPRMNNVGFLTPGLNRRIGVEQTNARRTPTNTLEVYCVFRNRTKYTQQIQVRTQFFGAQGEPLEGPDAWQNVFLAPNTIQPYRSYSTRIDPVFYYIEVQEMP